MAFEGYERFEFAREGRILTATISAPGPVNAVDAALHAVTAAERGAARLGLRYPAGGSILLVATRP